MSAIRDYQEWESIKKGLDVESVVTWESPAGARINVCEVCEAYAKWRGFWWKDEHGQEYVNVHHGKHDGDCDICY